MDSANTTSTAALNLCPSSDIQNLETNVSTLFDVEVNDLCNTKTNLSSHIISTSSSTEASLMHINSPVTEYINLTPRNTRQMILYVNTKVLQCHDDTGPNPSSEMDMELADIFQKCPPDGFRNKDNIPKSMMTSVEDVSLYRGTTDLDQMGNAAYFKQIITPGKAKVSCPRPLRQPRSICSSTDVSFPDLLASCTGSFRRNILASLIPKRQNQNVDVNQVNFQKKWYRRLKMQLGSMCHNCYNCSWCLRTRRYQNCEDDLDITSVSSYPKPIMVPVLTRLDNRWFFGSKLPFDQDQLIRNEQKTNRDTFFQN